MNDIRYLVTLECLHTTFFRPPAPKVYSIIWCVRCRKEVKVINAPAEWRIRCVECIYSRPFGTSRSDAEIAIGKHRGKYPTHNVKLFNGHRLINIYGNRDQTVMF